MIKLSWTHYWPLFWSICSNSSLIDVELLLVSPFGAMMLCDEEELGEVRSVGEKLPEPNPFANEAINDDGSGALM